MGSSPVLLVTCEQVADGSAVEWKKVCVERRVDECGELDLALRRGERRWWRGSRREGPACDVAAAELACRMPTDGSGLVYCEVCVDLARLGILHLGALEGVREVLVTESRYICEGRRIAEVGRKLLPGEGAELAESCDVLDAAARAERGG